MTEDFYKFVVVPPGLYLKCELLNKNADESPSELAPDKPANDSYKTIRICNWGLTSPSGFALPHSCLVIHAHVSAITIIIF